MDVVVSRDVIFDELAAFTEVAEVDGEPMIENKPISQTSQFDNKPNSTYEAAAKRSL